MKKIIRLKSVLVIVLIIGACASKPLPLVVEDDVAFSIPYPSGSNQFVFEYAQQGATLEKYVIVYGSGKLFLEIPEIDTNKVGETEYIIKSNLEDYVVSVLIEDTQKPIISGETAFTIQEGEALDLSDKLMAEDPVDGVLDVTFDKSDFSKAGEHTVIASATDINGNVTTETIVVTVIAKPKTVVQKPATPKPTPKPDTDKPDPTPTPAPAPTPAPVTPPVTDNNPFNSSRVPDSTSPSGFDFYDDTINLSDGSVVTRVSVDPQFNSVGILGKDRSGDTFSIVWNLDDMSRYIANKKPDFGEGVLHTELPAIAKTYMAYYE